MIKKLLIVFLIITPTLSFSENKDIQLLRFINSSSTREDNFFKFLSNSNNEVILGVPVTMGVISLIKNDDQLFINACQMVAADVINLGITRGMKAAVNRERPFKKYPDIIEKSVGGGPSFPSGHTSSAFATATTLSLQYPKWYVIVPSYLWAGSVGYSRMHLGVHYPSDVVGGILVGAGSAFLSFKVNKWLKNYSFLRHGHHQEQISQAFK
jgi:membrane-associated phospholipid phosphatase